MTHISIIDCNSKRKETAKLELVRENIQLTSMMNEIKLKPRIKPMFSNDRIKQTSMNFQE
jgi:hypothetical protein